MINIVCDVLVIGGGAAGCRAAREAKKQNPELDVLMVVSGKLGASGSTTLFASEALGINAPYNMKGDGDSPENYYLDIIETGLGMADPQLSKIIAYESSDRLDELIELGMEFDLHNGKIRQQKLSGCKYARSLTCGGSTGKDLVNVLKDDMLKRGVKVLEKVDIYDLLMNENGDVCGARGIKDNEDVEIISKSVVLATGGAASIFRQNVTPSSQTGDGWGMAFRAGCKFINMEFFQIGPAIVWPKAKFIIHSHMWRFNPKITNKDGEEFISKYCEDGVTAEDALYLKAMSYPFSTRTDAKYVDISIFKEIISGRGTDNKGVYFDVTHIPRTKMLEKAPITYETLLKLGADISEVPIEVSLAVQNFNGGILIDSDGFTGVNGLYAAGEVTGGVHGADRPGGNNLTDTQVFGYRAGVNAAINAANINHTQKPIQKKSRLNDDTENSVKEEISKIFYDNLTIVREEKNLLKTLDFINNELLKDISISLYNRLIIGKLLATATLERKESRGTHYREDYKNISDEQLSRIILSNKNGDVSVQRY